jgi:hypothetical protein
MIMVSNGKMISLLLEELFYRRTYDARARLRLALGTF